MPGPAPKPTALKKLAGNPGGRPLNEAEPNPQRRKMHPPAALSEKAKAEWRRLAPQLYQLGLLTVADRAALAAYCQAWADWTEALQELEKSGKILTTDKGYSYLNPWYSVKVNAETAMHKFGALFGLDPADRSKVHAQPAEKEKSLAEILFAGLEPADDQSK